MKSIVHALVILLTGSSGFVPSVYGVGLVRTYDEPFPNTGTTSGNNRFGTSLAIDGDNVFVGAPGGSRDAYVFDITTGNLLRPFIDPTGINSLFGEITTFSGDFILSGHPTDSTNGLAVGRAYLLAASSGDLIHTFDDPTVTSIDLFGGSIALDGNHILIGASGDDTIGTGVGQAYLFDAVSGNLLHIFNDPTRTIGDQFGFSVALDGNRALIGAPNDDTNGTNVGQVYLFDLNTMNLLQTFNDPTVTDEDRFGFSVALDGNHVLVGALRDDTNGTNVGQAHLFDATTGNLLHTFDDPTPSGGDEFGVVAALDGSHVLIGAPSDDTNGLSTGQAHLFDASSGELLHTFDDPTPLSLEFGHSVALDGNRIFIGDPRDSTIDHNVGQVHFYLIPEPTTLTLVLAILCLAVVQRKCKLTSA